MTTSTDFSGRQRALTVVIPTLGGDSLGRTIGALNSGSVVPAEVLVCIPEDEAQKVAHLSFENMKVLVTQVRGQVAQRAVGFRSASYPAVMQLDDDMLVDERCVERLLDTLGTNGPEVVVAPALVSLTTGESVYKRPKGHRLLQRAYDRIMHGRAGYRPGGIDKAGSAIGVDPALVTQRVLAVEWLPGGCVMHHRHNLVLEDFYPIRGKAYREDVIHSHHLKKRGCRLVVDTEARCRLEPAPLETLAPRESFTHLAGDFRARRYCFTLRRHSLLRMGLFYLAWCARYAATRLARSKIAK